MRVFLMFRDRDFVPQERFSPLVEELVEDLELEVLFTAMALGDDYLHRVARAALLSSLHDIDTILYRQAILKDCLNNASIIKAMYALVVKAVESKKRTYLGGIFSRYPSSILSGAVELLQVFVEMLRELRSFADRYAHRFTSEGFVRFFTMLQEELDDAYLARVEEHLRELRFHRGVLISARLGKGNVGEEYTLCRFPETKGIWIKAPWQRRSPVYSFSIDPRDESGARALSELRDRGVNTAANALAQSQDHVMSFFEALRLELAFYVGCLNLYEQLTALGEPIAFPLPFPPEERNHFALGLYDPCLALTMQRQVVGNDLDACGKDLVIIIGANQGGKSTFLRSVGLAQLMMQCGMFVPAVSFSASLCEKLFTHFRRREDMTMKSGKLDEELKRMSDIVDELTPNSMVLFNESFASTNEREGSEIARQIVDALLDRRVKIFFVTHLYEFAYSFSVQKMENVLFLRAERGSDGKRTFRLVEGEPLETSYGEDLYRKIFGIPEDLPLRTGETSIRPSVLR
jgi:DNA mismatch repair ATPase MutS